MRNYIILVEKTQPGMFPILPSAMCAPAKTEKRAALFRELPFLTACYPVENFDQNAIFSRRKSFTSLMGTRTCSMLSRSRMVTQWSAAMPFASSPTVSKSKVMQYGVPISSSRR